MHQFPVKEEEWDLNRKFPYRLFFKICWKSAVKKKDVPKKKHKHPKGTASVFSVAPWAAGLLGQTFVKAGMPFGIPWLT